MKGRSCLLFLLVRGMVSLSQLSSTAKNLTARNVCSFVCSSWLGWGFLEGQGSYSYTPAPAVINILDFEDI